MREITDIIQFLTLQRIKYNAMATAIKNEVDSVLIKINDNLTLWFDLWIDKDNDLNGDWNQTIFDLNDSKDNELKAYQSDAENFDTCFSVAEEYLTKSGVLTEEKWQVYTKSISTQILLA